MLEDAAATRGERDARGVVDAPRVVDEEESSEEEARISSPAVRAPARTGRGATARRAEARDARRGATSARESVGAATRAFIARG